MVSLEFLRKEAREKAKAPPWETGLSWGWEDLGKALMYRSGRDRKRFKARSGGWPDEISAGLRSRTEGGSGGNAIRPAGPSLDLDIESLESSR